jgi:hypothetical protein
MQSRLTHGTQRTLRGILGVDYVCAPLDGSQRVSTVGYTH